jgi:Fic family protein
MELLKQTSPERLAEILAAVPGPTVSGKYLHWDDLRHREPPGGLSVAEWWVGLKLRRSPDASIPLTDLSGRPFSFRVVDMIQQELHGIDLLTGGAIRMPEALSDPETKLRFLARGQAEEAITSSQLEGAITTREVAKELIRTGRAPRDRSERMILNNHLVMRRIGEVRAEPLTPSLVFELHRLVTDGTLDDPTAAGRFRRDDEYRVLGDEFGEVFHRPPPAGQLPDRLAMMCDFANDPGRSGFVHPVVRSILLHFWLAYDHPFIDGNGRTARALFYWSALRHQYWPFEYLSISRPILRAPRRYGEAYLHVETDDNDLTYFLLYHLDIVRKAREELSRFIEERGQQLLALEQRLPGTAHLNRRQRELIRHALRHPGFAYTIEAHRASHGVAPMTARTDLLDLEAHGLLVKTRRGRAWVFTPVRDLASRLADSP